MNKSAGKRQVDGIGEVQPPESERLQRLLRDIVVAADRMRDGWAESDKAVKKQLWQNLHEAAEAAYDEVYPL